MIAMPALIKSLQHVVIQAPNPTVQARRKKQPCSSDWHFTLLGRVGNKQFKETNPEPCVRRQSVSVILGKTLQGRMSPF